MKKLLALAAVTIVSLQLTGCLVAPVQPPMGILYTSYQAPLDYDQSNSSVGSKSGSAETMSILGLVALGDGSVKTAASNGGLSTISGADYEYLNIIGVYQKYTTIVHGE
ncbi:hypothetical protein GC173_10920 [bacterium]|nr:hypothetical protein [bacterium]